jgi:uncharacterized protein YndB with AHSA1/START domain
MPRVRARRVVASDPETVWRLVGDPNQLSRWWPRTVRVEGVTGRAFTIVMTSSRGREVRADQRVLADERLRRRAWALEVAGTPFESVFASSETEVSLAPAPGGTEVSLELHQRLRGPSRLGGLLVRRSGRRQLRAALAAVAAELG